MTKPEEDDPMFRLIQARHHSKSYWVGDPVIEKLAGDRGKEIRAWLKKVRMEP